MNLITQRLSEMHIIVCLLVKPRAAAIYDLCKCSGRAKEQQSTLVAHSMSQVGHNKDIHVEIKRTIWRGTAGWNSKDSRMKKIFMRRDIYGAWEQYLGLEHNDSAPKKSYAVNQ
ncbi:hypothetical protein JHK86_050822 [Glycine max]|nr:hypothetical protein JHK86_050822 [Glycine max]